MLSDEEYVEHMIMTAWPRTTWTRVQDLVGEALLLEFHPEDNRPDAAWLVEQLRRNRWAVTHIRYQQQLPLRVASVVAFRVPQEGPPNAPGSP